MKRNEANERNYEAEKEQRNELKLQTDFSSEQVIYDPFKERFFDIFYST